MSVSSFEFVVLVLLGAAVFFHLPGVRARQLFLFTANILFLCTFMRDAASWAALAAFLLTGYGVGRLLARRPSSLLLAGYLILLVGAFMVLKKYVVLRLLLPDTVWAHTLGIIGLSYMLFRQIHFIVDAMQGQIASPSLWAYANYQMNLFALVSGPIQRYQVFAENWRTLSPQLTTRHEVLRAHLRLAVGLLSIALVAPLFLSGYDQMTRSLSDPRAAEAMSRASAAAGFAIVFYAFPLYLYFNFSGYCNIVIAAAALFGLKLPENFDRPYLSRNLIEYWTRFHQSLGYWIRDYLFTPLYKSAAGRWSRYAKALVYPFYFIAFVLAGVWHGSTWNYAVFGLLHGSGATVVKLWETRLLKRGGRKHLKEYMQSRPIRIASTALTLHFVCFTLLFFNLNVKTALGILGNFWKVMT